MEEDIHFRMNEYLLKGWFLRIIYKDKLLDLYEVEVILPADLYTSWNTTTVTEIYILLEEFTDVNETVT